MVNFLRIFLFKQFIANIFIENYYCTNKSQKNFDLSLENCLNLLTLTDLIQLCRKFKINHTQNRTNLISDLKKMSYQKNVFQSSIGDVILKRF